LTEIFRFKVDERWIKATWAEVALSLTELQLAVLRVLCKKPTEWTNIPKLRFNTCKLLAKKGLVIMRRPGDLWQAGPTGKGIWCVEKLEK
jgi:hypothetical protein